MKVDADLLSSGETISVDDLGSIEAVLAGMWLAAEEAEGLKDGPGGPPTRVSLGNLIVVTAPERSGRISEALDRLSVRRPCRVIVVEMDSKSDTPGVRTGIRAVCHRPSPDAPQVCCEQVHLACGPRGYRLLPGIVTPLLEADLTSLLWWDREWIDCREIFERLASGIGSLLIDLEEMTSIRGIGDLRERLPNVVIHDLAWARIEPWRRELARVFDDALMRGMLPAVNEVKVDSSGPKGPTSAAGLLYLGWLVSQLGWRVTAPLVRSGRGWAAFVESPSGKVTLHLEPSDGSLGASGDRGARALGSFEIRDARGSEVHLSLTADAATLVTAVKVPQSCPLPRRTQAEAPGADQVAGAALELAGARDPVYEKALICALRLAPAEG